MKYQVIDADSHVIEPPDLWKKYIAPSFRKRAPGVVRRRTGDMFEAEKRPPEPIGLVSAAGKPKDTLNPHGRFDEVIYRGAWDPDARIADMERDGVDASVVYPTFALRLFALADVDLKYACMEAYNNWFVDFYRAQPKRLKGPGVICTEEIGRAVAELKRVTKLGLAGGLINIDPDGPSGYGHKRFDRLWATAQDLDVPIAMHLGQRARADDDATTKGARVSTSASITATKKGEFKLKTFVGLGPVPIQNTLQDVILSGVLERFPRLKLVSVESDAGWAVHFLERMDEIVRGEEGMRMETNLTGKLLPSEMFHRNVYLTFIRDRNALLCRDVIGVNNMMWSSDFPHPFGCWPGSQILNKRQFEGIPEAAHHKIVADNAKHLYNFGS